MDIKANKKPSSFKVDKLEEVYDRIIDCKKLDLTNKANLKLKKELAKMLNSDYYGSSTQKSHIDDLFNHLFLIEYEDPQKGKQLFNDYILTININKARILKYFTGI